MSIYQKVTLAGPSPVGHPSALPADVAGLADADLADLSWSSLDEHSGVGYWPVTVDIPPFNPATHQVSGEIGAVNLDVLAKRVTAEAVIIQRPAPAEVAMHKVHKAALLTPWGENGETNLKAAIEAAFELLPPPSNVLARIEWDKAPNLVRDGATTAAVVAILGMTETQRDELLIFAATLP